MPQPVDCGDMVVMGRVGAPHGVRGEATVRPLSSSPSTLLEAKRWWIRRPAADAAWRPCRLRGARMTGGQILVQIDEALTRDAAAAWRGAEIGIQRGDLPPPGRDEWYRHDLVGMEVVTREGVRLGTVHGFADSGAHPLLEVAAGDGVERLIPWVPEYVIAVDEEARRIDVDWQPDY
ncbi:MAG: 16S rRNA processing protein RimM [Proteobacteria bacterium]|nr:16S rRNA processing protein RimM [Pseudomonadota bacterium]